MDFLHGTGGRPFPQIGPLVDRRLL